MGSADMQTLKLDTQDRLFFGPSEESYTDSERPVTWECLTLNRFPFVFHSRLEASTGPWEPKITGQSLR